ncbi:MAG: pentapeptide repeat-containing protein [Bacteroidota bacterium]
MCIFAKILGKKKNSITDHRFDLINLISIKVVFASLIILLLGQQFGGFSQIGELIIVSYSEWLGILIDGILLFSINWAIRREEKKRLFSQFGSESNAFALDATKQLRKKGWLNDGRLSGINLIHAQLQCANLSQSVLNNVDLSHANLNSANLVEADLRGSDLTAADLSNTECRWTDFRNANLRWANLEGAILDGARFEGADLRFAKLGDINENTVSFAGAKMSESLSEREVFIIQNSVSMIQKSMKGFSMEFYRELFKANPMVKALFIAKIEDQASKFAQFFELLISSLDNMEKIIPALKTLGKRHTNYGVKDYHYRVVGEALICTLKKSLGHHFDKELEQAWLKAFGLLTMIMQDSSRGLMLEPVMKGVSVAAYN